MKKPELVAALAVASGGSKAAAERVLDAMGPVIQAALDQGKTVVIPGVGKIGIKPLSAREVTTPQGIPMSVPARSGVKFVAAKALRDALREDE